MIQKYLNEFQIDILTLAISKSFTEQWLTSALCFNPAHFLLATV